MPRIAQGDRAAFDQLAARHLLRLRRTALRILDDVPAAEDVAQEALLRAWNAAGRYDPARASVATWLHRIGVNLAVDCLRRRRDETGVPEDLADPAATAEQVLSRRQQQSVLAGGIAALPSRQRAAIGLVYGQERSGAEAARALDVSVRALEGLLRRGRTMLRSYLSAGGA